jgi:hypothetical protein
MKCCKCKNRLTEDNVIHIDIVNKDCLYVLLDCNNCDNVTSVFSTIYETMPSDKNNEGV